MSNGHEVMRLFAELPGRDQAAVLLAMGLHLLETDGGDLARLVMREDDGDDVLAVVALAAGDRAAEVLTLLDAIEDEEAGT